MDYFYKQNASYLLLFAHQELGSVIYLDADFPHRWGIFSPLRHNDSILKHVWDYYDFWLEADRIEQTRGEQAQEVFVRENESDFFHLIESNDWMLRKADVTESIVCPIFYLSGHIIF